MNWVKSLIIAFSMYSKIPMPHLNLEEKICGMLWDFSAGRIGAWCMSVYMV